MLTVSMNSKRERRPNVRLEEIGDLPAAVSFVHKVRGGENTCADAVGSNFDLGFYNRAIRAFACLDSVTAENSSTSADMQEHIENTNPNSCKPGFGPSSSDDIGLGDAEVAFGNVTKKRRAMKRKKWASNSGGALDISDSGPGSNDSAKDSRKQAKGCYPHNSSVSSDFYPVDGGTSSTAGDQDYDDYITEPPFDTAHKSNLALVYSVDGWLEQKGFGEYVEMFEMHEVDEAALPLLTIEDLKEMGVGADGPRRKLYNAIRRLKRDGPTDWQL
uniref:SAM domain-containing protein n=1 Tax=Kalanchoe fedtschenkoi TaxID=63787 RepID=A0A7N0V0R7_KALFE